ncbi:hypothetical protein [Nitrincola tibetensis]|nr:hypothetical protein [Nitrincola tibetensis]
MFNSVAQLHFAQVITSLQHQIIRWVCTPMKVWGEWFAVERQLLL